MRTTPEFNSVLSRMYKFLLNERGLELSEYAVAAALVAIVVVVAYSTLGNAIGVRLDQLANRVG